LLITLADQQEYLFGFQYEIIQMSFHCVLIASRRQGINILRGHKLKSEIKKGGGSSLKNKEGKVLNDLAFEEKLSVDQVRGSSLKNKEGKRLIDFGV
jgi:hypothetical protein